ncbi:hypothetical protein KP509_17G082300 [Ceratopteris richardii]|uniref:NAD(P)-binding domain-containing protein n=1 Tax=Ceratopteris richardii TaxID=49495 RepID=A0A8T2SXD7_CERRI|nr:hypothetical protein KP509_17G082300 [Ceratopteris richardii]
MCISFSISSFCVLTCNVIFSIAEMDYGISSRPRSQLAVKVVVVCSLTLVFMFMLRQSSTAPERVMFSRHDGITHVLVTGGAGYIGSHAVLRLLEDKYRVTIVDNLSRGNLGAVKTLQQLFPGHDRLQFILADLGDTEAVDHIFSSNAIDAVMHFAAVAYVEESVEEPLRYYKNITSNTLILLEAMKKHNVKKLIYSSTCATYGEPDKMPITEETPQKPINPYGKAKKMSEDIIKDHAKTTDLAATILRYFNVIGSDPKGILGEAPPPEFRQHGRISSACFDAALKITPGLKVKGTDYKTKDGTCIRDYIHVTDLVDAHVKALEKLRSSGVSIYNVGTGEGKSVKEFVDACKAATGVNIPVTYLGRRPGDYAEVWSDPTKIKVELNWSATYLDLKETLAMAWKWQQAHPKGYQSAAL